jgi:hypothetical protein
LDNTAGNENHWIKRKKIGNSASGDARSVAITNKRSLGEKASARSMSYTNLNFGNWRAPSQKTQNERAKGGAPYEGKLGVFVVGDGRAGGQ